MKIYSMENKLKICVHLKNKPLYSMEDIVCLLKYSFDYTITYHSLSSMLKYWLVEGPEW